MFGSFLKNLWSRGSAAAPASPLTDADRLLDAGQPAAALDAYDQVLAATPDAVPAVVGRAAALVELWRIEEAVATYARAQVLRPQSTAIHSAWLFHRHYLAEPDAVALAQAHRLYGARFATPALPARTAPMPDRRLRVGYLSPNFSRHSVGYFIEPVLAAHDRTAFEVTGYSLHPKSDDATARMRGLADRWREAAAWDDAQLERAIRDDGIDLLIDLAGHTKLNRLPVLARKPAPLQFTWLGYPDTTGVTAIDFRITDAIVDPPGPADTLHTEALLRLPGSFLCYQPPSDAPAVSPRPVDAALTFGSFNNLDKLSAQTVALWARVLQAVPEARLLLKSARTRVPEAVERIHAAFAAQGIAPARVTFAAWRDRRSDHLTAYADVDIALDTSPYHGTTTTCEALWMGVPVVTRTGGTHVSRVGATLLMHTGLPELVAADDEAFVAAATGLARDAARRAALRAGLRERLAASPLTDAATFTRSLEAAYRTVWRSWCAAQARPAGGTG
jgi:predicted O-linked N-acetylglucosamine transferase (SPINDLY family)